MLLIYGYVMLRVSRWHFMHNMTHQVTLKVWKADRSVTQNIHCVLGWSTCICFHHPTPYIPEFILCHCTLYHCSLYLTPHPIGCIYLVHQVATLRGITVVSTYATHWVSRWVVINTQYPTGSSCTPRCTFVIVILVDLGLFFLSLAFRILSLVLLSMLLNYTAEFIHLHIYI